MKRLPFSDEMFLAFLDERKTQTRRVINPQPWIDFAGLSAEYNPFELKILVKSNDAPFYKNAIIQPEYQPGSIVAISAAITVDLNGDIIYRANGQKASDKNWKWKPYTLPARFCPLWCCQHKARIVSVRAQRVNEISEADAIAEGMIYHDNGKNSYGIQNPSWLWKKENIENSDYCLGSAKLAFGNLWIKLHTKPGEGFFDGPFAWVYELKKVS